MNIISMIGVSHSFQGVPLFNDLNLNIESGLIHGLTGPNGSGKSVLLRMMCGFIVPNAGVVEIDPSFLPAGRTFPNNFGVIIDGPAYLPGLSAEGNLRELASIQNRIGVAEIRMTLTRVGLIATSRKRVRSFSLGMKQKLSIAQAIMEDQKVLLLDEPFNALDDESVGNVKALLREQRDAGVTILFTSHSKHDVAELCDRVYRLEAGRAHLIHPVT